MEKMLQNIKLEMKQETSSSDEYEEETAADVFAENEAKSLFPSGKLIGHKSTGTENYVLHLDGTLQSDPNIAASLSNQTCEVYHFSNNQFAKVEVLRFESPLVGAKFSQENENLLFTTSNQLVQLWDLRTPKKPVQSFTDGTDGGDKKVKISFDISCNDRLLAVGTELYETDAFIIFWDTRNANLLGGYWESHQQAITSVAFHPEDPNKLASGSTDGLINIYDLSKVTETQALTDTFNTEASVYHLLWQRKRFLYCSTYTDIQVWNADTGDIASHFRSEEIVIANKGANAKYCDIVNAHTTKNDEFFALIGSKYQGEECARGFKIMQKCLVPFVSLSGDKQKMRSSWFNKYTNVLLMGGERGYLNMWQL